MKISKAQISALRVRTGAGLRDCKDALSSADGDLEKAIVLLSQKKQRHEVRAKHLVRRTWLAAVMMDGSFLAAEILVEETLWEWANIGLLSCLIVLAFWGLRLIVGYSVHHRIEPACEPLHRQLGLPGLRGLAAAGHLLVGGLVWLVAAVLPILGVSLVMVECGYPDGVDSFQPGTLPRNALSATLCVVMLFSVTLTYSAELFFRGKARVPWEQPALDYAVPVLAIMVGASVSIVGHHLLSNDFFGTSTDGLVMVGLYLYLPMRYLLCRAAGLSRVSLLLWGLTITVYTYIA